MTPQKEGYAKLKWFSKFQSLKKYSRLSDWNRTRTDYHLIRKRTINHVAKLDLTFKYCSKPICDMRKISSEYSRLCSWRSNPSGVLHGKGLFTNFTKIRLFPVTFTKFIRTPAKDCF